MIGLGHNATDVLELAELPRRGACSSVTAKSFPDSLGEAFDARDLAGSPEEGRSGVGSQTL